MRSPIIAYLTLLFTTVMGALQAEFTTVINLPDDPAPKSLEAGTQLNIYEGGILPYSATIFTAQGGEINLLGGQIATNITARGETALNVLSGHIGSPLYTYDHSHLNVMGGNLSDVYTRGSSTALITGGNFNSTVRGQGSSSTTIEGGNFWNTVYFAEMASATVEGGTFLENMNVYGGATVLLRGDDFRIDGVEVSELSSAGDTFEFFTAPGRVVSGTLADGTPFSFKQGPATSDGFGKFRLELVPLALSHLIIHVPTDVAPSGLRGPQLMLVNDGGSVPDPFIAGWGSAVAMHGGRFENHFRGYHARLSVSGGSVGNLLALHHESQFVASGGSFQGVRLAEGSHAEISGGTFGNVSLNTGATSHVSGGELASASVRAQSEFTLSGGTVAGSLEVRAQGHADIKGGLVADSLLIYRDGSATISGGRIGRLGIDSNAALRLVGGEFRINGDPVTGLVSVGDSRTITVPADATFTGILADGTPIHFSRDDSDGVLPNVTLQLASLPQVVPDAEFLVSERSDFTLRQGQHVVVLPSGRLPDYFRASAGAQVTVHSGTVGHHFEADGTTVELHSGSIGDEFAGFVGTHLTVGGGSLGNQGRLSGGSHLEMTGGSVGDSFHLYSGSTATIRRGTIGKDFRVVVGTATIHGGTFGGDFQVGAPPPPPRGTEGDSDSTAIVVPASATVEIHAGNFQNIQVHKMGVANIHGGTLEKGLVVREGTANVFGGTIGDGWRVETDSSITIHGGEIGEGSLLRGATATIYGTAFNLDPYVPPRGKPFSDHLTPNVPYLLHNRNATLTATLVDGTQFECNLASPLISPGAKLYLVLVQVPEPTTLTLTVLPLGGYLFYRRRLLTL